MLASHTHLRYDTNMFGFEGSIGGSHADRIAEFCSRHRIARLAILGSGARGELTPDSDIDLLYEFEDGYSPGWGIVRIQDEASELFDGRIVDLVPFKYVNRHIRAQVAELLYHPTARRVLGYADVRNSSPAVMDHEEDTS